MVNIYTVILIILMLFSGIYPQELPYEAIEGAYYQSYQFESEKRYSDAIKALGPVLKRYENGYTVNFRIGWLTYLDGNYQDALKYYKKALVVYPASVEVLNSISLVYKAMNDWTKVEEQNYQILKIDYFNLTANYWYAVALKTRRKYELAENVCRKMLTIYPTSVMYLQELGEVLYYQKKYNEALDIFSSVKILDPKNITAPKYIELISSNSIRK